MSKSPSNNSWTIFLNSKKLIIINDDRMSDLYICTEPFKVFDRVFGPIISIFTSLGWSIEMKRRKLKATSSDNKYTFENFIGSCQVIVTHNNNSKVITIPSNTFTIDKEPFGEIKDIFEALDYTVEINNEAIVFTKK